MSKLIIYAYTTPSLIDISQTTGMMKVKVGQTTYDPKIDPKISAQRRINQQANASSHEPLQMVGFWVIETNDRFKSDKDLHKLLVESNYQQVVGGKGKEWFWFPTNNPDIAKSQIARKITELSKIVVIPRKKPESVARPVLVSSVTVEASSITYVSAISVIETPAPKHLIPIQPPVPAPVPAPVIEVVKGTFIPPEIFEWDGRKFEIKLHPFNHVWEGFIHGRKVATAVHVNNTISGVQQEIRNLFPCYVEESPLSFPCRVVEQPFLETKISDVVPTIQQNEVQIARPKTTYYELPEKIHTIPVSAPTKTSNASFLTFGVFLILFLFGMWILINGGRSKIETVTEQETTYQETDHQKIPQLELQPREVRQFAIITSKKESPILSEYYLSKYNTLISTLRNKNKSDEEIYSILDKFEFGDRLEAEQEICNAGAISFPFCKKSVAKPKSEPEPEPVVISQRELLVELE